MARFYADEQFPLPVVELLRILEHDVLTVQEAGNAYQGILDEEVRSDAKATALSTYSWGVEAINSGSPTVVSKS